MKRNLILEEAVMLYFKMALGICCVYEKGKFIVLAFLLMNTNFCDSKVRNNFKEWQLWSFKICIKDICIYNLKMYEKGKSLKFNIQGISCLLKYCYACSIHLPLFAKSNFEFPYQKKKLKNLTNSCKLFLSLFHLKLFVLLLLSALHNTWHRIQMLWGYFVVNHWVPGKMSGRI